MTASRFFGAPPRRGWWLAVAAVVAGQLALVFWLGDKTPVIPRRADHEPRVLMAAKLSPAWLEVLNPTLFAWSGPHGFSGPAWLRTTPPANQPYAWTEPARFLELDPQQLSLVAPDAASQPTRHWQALEAGRVSDMKLPLEAWTDSALPTRSLVRVEGELAARALKTSLQPRSWAVDDVLPDTEVRVLVDGPGRVMSATLVKSSGLPAADASALELARGARFAAGSPWQTGRLVFRWHTVPASEDDF